MRQLFFALSARRQTMACPFLTGTRIPICTVHGGNYSLSTFELEEYCLSDKAKMCPHPSLMLFGIGRTAQRGVYREAIKKAA
jgi:hypothetical protein